MQQAIGRGRVGSILLHDAEGARVDKKRSGEIRTVSRGD